MIKLIVELIVLGVIAWAVYTYLPLQPPFKGLLMFLFILIACFIVLAAFGIVSAPLALGAGVLPLSASLLS